MTARSSGVTHAVRMSMIVRPKRSNPGMLSKQYRRKTLYAIPQERIKCNLPAALLQHQRGGERQALFHHPVTTAVFF